VAPTGSGGDIERRILCWGPAAGGKTAALGGIRRRLAEGSAGPLLAGPGGETLFVDLLSLDGGSLDGRRLRFHLVAVPGRPEADAREVRRRAAAIADGVLFVADSAPDRLQANAASLRELEELLELRAERDVPVVMVYNKRDLPDALPVARLESELNPSGRESFEAVATRGEGLAEALVAVSRRIVEALV